MFIHGFFFQRLLVTFQYEARRYAHVDKILSQMNLTDWVMAPLFLDIDVLASPTLAAESFRYDPEDAYGGFDAERQTVAGEPLAWFDRSIRFVRIWDFNGYPTLSLPCGFSPDGMPLSVQLVGAPLDEAKLCRAGFAFEQANDFHRRHPEL